jgi:adenylate kinase family enzyme
VFESPSLGRRIVVWGATGSGKTTMAGHLSVVVGVPAVELDAIRHRGGWDAVDLPEMRTLLEVRLQNCAYGWVIDGSYNAISDVYLPDVETLIWLHLPWHVSFWRLFKRTVYRAWTREPLYQPDGPRESWRLTFLSRRSILWWSISHHRTAVRTYRARIAALPPGVRVHELRSAREVRQFMQRLEATDQPV